MKIIHLFLSLLLIILIVGNVIPYGFPLVIPFTCVITLLIVFDLLSKKNQINISLNLKYVLLVFFLVIIYIIAVLKTQLIYETTKNDLKNIFFLLNMLLILAYLRALKFDFLLFYKYFTNILSCIAFPVSALCIYKYLVVFYDIRNYFLKDKWLEYQSSSLQADNNIYALSILIFIFVLLSKYKNNQNVLIKTFYIFSILSCFTAGILSTSRRFYVLISIILLIFTFKILINTYKIHKKKYLNKKLKLFKVLMLELI